MPLLPLASSLLVSQWFLYLSSSSAMALIGFVHTVSLVCQFSSILSLGFMADLSRTLLQCPFGIWLFVLCIETAKVLPSAKSYHLNSHRWDVSFCNSINSALLPCPLLIWAIIFTKLPHVLPLHFPPPLYLWNSNTSAFFYFLHLGGWDSLFEKIFKNEFIMYLNLKKLKLALSLEISRIPWFKKKKALMKGSYLISGWG